MSDIPVILKSLVIFFDDTFCMMSSAPLLTFRDFLKGDLLKCATDAQTPSYRNLTKEKSRTIIYFIEHLFDKFFEFTFYGMQTHIKEGV